VSLFEQCELRFHAEKVLGLGDSAQSAGPAVRRGSALHVLLQLAGEDGVLDDERLEAVAKHYRLEADDAKRVRQAFDAYRASAVAEEVRSFNSIRREAPFALWIGAPGDGFILDGTIDVYATTADHALIVDYKSGETGRTLEDLTDRYALQAGCYALAAVRDGAHDVEVVFVRPEVLEGGEPQVIRFDFTAAEAEELSRELSLTHKRMGVSGWAHRDQRDERACENCPVLAQMCEVKAAHGHRHG
jgi:ATP-dependent helicase/DNAse subunit B